MSNPFLDIFFQTVFLLLFLISVSDLYSDRTDVDVRPHSVIEHIFQHLQYGSIRQIDCRIILFGVYDRDRLQVGIIIDSVGEVYHYLVQFVVLHPIPPSVNRPQDLLGIVSVLYRLVNIPQVKSRRD